MKRKTDLIYPTDEEEAAINRGIAQDADNPELTAGDFSRMKRTRGPQKAPLKQPVSMRLDAEIGGLLDRSMLWEMD
ncbi:hypothetical protein [Brytella acorum]|uniref:Uncharacterized protein n=1 Tax=Brytella acorum TaxID=2959299 RepID=A0AA35Y0D8_9PROT|nr:hypothetical protein [Brytella acorum]CAI9119553.1 hypothetical protein LMG32879_000370 [Brytella acorum]